MTREPFRVERRDELLWVALDTPGAAVNIFDNRAAAQLSEVLASLEPDVKAVVLASDKAASFVNGVGLLMATTVRSPDDARRLSSSVRGAYRDVREAGVLTVAAIRGTAYGCGVELALQCDLRIAADTFDTHFYMTELNDYLFNPVFGATVTLPLVLGLDRAAEFLLWGRRHGPTRARRVGLVHAVVDDGAFDEQVARLVRRQLGRGAVGRAPVALRQDLDGIAARHGARIARLPPSYRPVYRRCLALMKRVAQRGRITEADREREVRLSGESVARPASKGALGFFFVRQTADALCRGEGSDRVGIRSPSEHDAAGALVEVLAKRPLRGVTVRLGRRRRGSTEHDFVLVTSDSRERGGPERRVVVEGDLGQRPTRGADLQLYSPMPEPPTVVELACSEPDPTTRVLYGTLSRFGLRVVVTHPRDRFAFDELLAAHLAPIVKDALRGRSPRAIDADLCGFGFVRRVPALCHGLDSVALATLLTEHVDAPTGEVTRCLERLAKPLQAPRRTRQRGRLLDALTLSWLDVALALRRHEVITHPTIVDVAAREVLDFPLGRGSFCRFLTRARIAEILPRVAHNPLVDERAVGAALGYVEAGRDFYL